MRSSARVRLTEIGADRDSGCDRHIGSQSAKHGSPGEIAARTVESNAASLYLDIDGQRPARTFGRPRRHLYQRGYGHANRTCCSSRVEQLKLSVNREVPEPALREPLRIAEVIERHAPAGLEPAIHADGRARNRNIELAISAAAPVTRCNSDPHVPRLDD